MKLLGLLLVLGSVAQASTCKLERVGKVSVPGKEVHPQEISKLSNDTITFYQQDQKRHVFLKSDGSIETISASEYYMLGGPQVLENGNAQFSTRDGKLIEFDPELNVVNVTDVGLHGQVFWTTQLDSNRKIATTSRGKVFTLDTKQNQTSLLFDLNEGVISDDAKDGFYIPGFSYQNRYIVLNPALFGAIQLIDLSGKKVFEDGDLIQNSFRKPFVMKDGRLAIFGGWGLDGLVRFVDPTDSFKTSTLHLSKPGRDLFVGFFDELKNGNLIAGVIEHDDSVSAYHQRIYFLSPSGDILHEHFTEHTGLSVDWDILELEDGNIVNVAKDQVQLLSADGELLSSDQLDANPNSEVYQAVNDKPIRLSDGRIVIQGDGSDFFYYRKSCH